MGTQIQTSCRRTPTYAPVALSVAVAALLFSTVTSAGRAPQPALDLGEQGPLVCAGQVAAERAVLKPLEAIVQAGVGNLLARTVVRDIVDQ